VECNKDNNDIGEKKKRNSKGQRHFLPIGLALSYLGANRSLIIYY
jgi:hypothetical protein